MERTIAIVGGGDLVIEDSSPPIEGVMSGAILEAGGRYSFMLSSTSARRLVEAMREGNHLCVFTFTGEVVFEPPRRGNPNASLRFYATGAKTAEKVCELYDGAIDAAADALAEAAGPGVLS
jgi:hypothetical protein